jgi:hypothetical protein
MYRERGAECGIPDIFLLVFILDRMGDVHCKIAYVAWRIFRCQFFSDVRRA